VNPVPVGLTGTNVRQIRVPDLVATLQQVDALGRNPILGVAEQAQLYPGRVFRVEGEIGPLAIPRGTEWGRGAAPRLCHARASLGDG
jgi:hypothetical protein